MKLSVIIVSYNVQYYVEQCLRSLEKALSGIAADIYVVDNHSKDDTVAFLSSKFPHVQVVASSHNLGFARANNLAIGETDSQYILLLNPDTVVGEHAIEEALHFMDEHPDAGSLGVRMLDTMGYSAKESRRGLPSPLVAFYKMSGLCARFPKHKRLGHYYMSDLPWDSPAPIEVVSGAFCLLRKEALDQVGFLDEDFFMYGEDIDLSYRILKGGYRNYYLPVKILHYKGESTQRSSFRYVHVFYEAMLIFFKKHYAGMSFLLSIPIKTAIYGKATVTLLKMQIQKARKSMGFVYPRYKTSPLYVFIGGDEMIEKCRRLSKGKGLSAIYIKGDEHSLPDGHLSETVIGEMPATVAIRYIVYDCDSFSYEHVFSIFSRCPDKANHIAFFYNDTERLVTEDEIMTVK